jgi:CheY-like chemotaxis protein
MNPNEPSATTHSAPETANELDRIKASLCRAMQMVGRAVEPVTHGRVVVRCGEAHHADCRARSDASIVATRRSEVRATLRRASLRFASARRRCSGMAMSSGYRSRARCVLFIDDESDIRLVYATALRKASFIVEEVGSVADALAYLDQRRPDAIILDRNLPDGDGFEIAPIARRIHENTFIVGFTAEPDGPSRRAAKEAGCDAFVPKTSAPAVLTETVAAGLDYSVAPCSASG